MTPRRSAGILLWRAAGNGHEVLIAHMGGPLWATKDERAWSIPKGEYDADGPDAEDALAAAYREFAEELGSPAPAGEPVLLGEVRQRNGKIVTAWALEGDLDVDTVVSNLFEMQWPPRSGRLQSFPEIDRAAWVSVATAARKLVAAQVTLLDRLPWVDNQMSCPQSLRSFHQMRSVTAYATPAAKAPFEKTTIERRDLRPTDVLIKIAFAGICHSDIHTGRGEWGETNYPLVPGHEIAGTIEEVGSNVSKFAVGDRAGVGCMVSSCGKCENCRGGEEQFCLEGMVGTYGGMLDGSPTAGGYSTHIVVDENYVLTIPEGIALDEAAPLLCAGITVYSPLNHWGAGEGKKVAIVGMGGLGHMGVKIAHAMGAEVTVLSQTTSKQEDGKEFGADHYYATSEDETFSTLAGSFDLIINTVSASLPMHKYLGLLKVRGAIVSVGAPSEPLEVPAFSLLGGAKIWAGSMIGGIRETQEMLDFCAEHHIGATIEKINADQIDEAWDRVVGSDVRYRFVIDASTFEN